MPKPREGEEKDAFISRCISELVDSEEREQDQAVAMCHEYWREHTQEAVKVPSPEEGESKEEFVARCVKDIMPDSAVDNEDQAVLICANFWDERMEKESLDWATLEIEPRSSESNEFTGSEWLVKIIGPEDGFPTMEFEGQEYFQSKNGRWYNLGMLAESASLWEGVKVYDNHLSDAEFAERVGQRSVKDEWLGSIKDVRWSEDEKALVGNLKIVDGSLASKLKNAWKENVIEEIGLSIDTFTDQREVNSNGETLHLVEEFTEIFSVDLVANPAAGGRFVRILASKQAQTTQIDKESEKMSKEEMRAALRELLSEELPSVLEEIRDAETEEVEEEDAEERNEESEEEEEEMEEEKDLTAAEAVERIRKVECQLTLEKVLKAANLPEKFEGVVRSNFEDRAFETKDLTNMVKKMKEALAENDESGDVEGAGSGNRQIQVGLNERDKEEIAFMQLLMGSHNMRAIESVEDEYVAKRTPEAFRAWVKDGRNRLPTYRVSEWVYDILGGNPFESDRAYEAVLTSDMTSIVKNTLNLMLAHDYAVREQWWDPIVTEMEVDNIDDATFAAVYGLDSLATVDEGAAYNGLNWEDTEETAVFQKRGNYVGITLEMLLSDKVNAVRTLPRRLSAAWYNTLSDLVSNVFTNNAGVGPTLNATSASLFNATALSSDGHANLGTSALSYSSYDAGVQAMKKQTDQTSGNGRRLLIRPRYLLVPVELTSTARVIRDSEKVPGAADNDMNPYMGSFDIIEVPQWTDSDNWALVADKAQYPAIWLVFLRGRKVPELYSSDDEQAGTFFTNDEIRYKVRMMSYQFSASEDCAPVSDFRPLYKANVS